MIWQFDNSQIYMLGSVHVMKEKDNNHQSVINDVYNKVSKIIFETSLDFEQNHSLHTKTTNYLIIFLRCYSVTLKKHG